jgi:hypothetical protein
VFENDGSRKLATKEAELFRGLFCLNNLATNRITERCFICASR